MKAVPGRFALYLVAASGFLAFCAGCYHPKADIDAFRPQAEKYFAALEKVGTKEFTSGETSGEAFLYEVNDAAAFHGGFPFAVHSSNQVSLTVHGDAAQQEIDRNLALRKDLDEQAEKLIHQKIKSSLPGAGFPSYW